MQEMNLTTPFVSRSEEKRVTAMRKARVPKLPTMNHEERIALIMKPFPQVNIIGRTGGWYGVSLTQRSIDVHKFLRGLVPSRRNAE